MSGDLNKNAVIQLKSFGLIAITGPDAAKFLQGQITCDVKEVSETQTRIGAHCDPKGRVQFLFRLLQINDDYYFFLPKEMITPALTFLKKYAVFSKVKLEDVSDEWMINGVMGDGCKDNFKKQFDVIPENIDQAVIVNNNCIIKISEQPIRYLVINKKLDCNLDFEQQLIADENFWNLLDVRAKIPNIILANSNEFTAHDLDLPALNGVSFTKGCYTGQEIVARMHYLGKLKQHLQRIEFSAEQAPALLTKLLNEQQTVGRLINVAKVAEGQYTALALIQDAALDKIIHLENSDNPARILL
jgi:folate-binding protein YgfZ